MSVLQVNACKEEGTLMAAQLADKGHPALQTMPADSFARLLEDGKQAKKPSPALLKLIANGKKSLQKG